MELPDLYKGLLSACLTAWPRREGKEAAVSWGEGLEEQEQEHEQEQEQEQEQELNLYCKLAELQRLLHIFNHSPL